MHRAAEIPEIKEDRSQFTSKQEIERFKCMHVKLHLKVIDR